jgi:cytochrome c553
MLLRIVVAAALLAGSAAASADTIEEKAALCAACHGEKGVSEDKSMPIIWGQNAGYLYVELRDFQSGARKDDRMTPIAQSLSKDDALALAEYLSSKSWPNNGAPEASKEDVAVATNVNKSVVCTSCHLAEFQGNSATPRLAGQEHDYLIKAMLSFRDGTRANNPGMAALMKTVTPEHLAAMANYLAGY